MYKIPAAAPSITVRRKTTNSRRKQYYGPELIYRILLRFGFRSGRRFCLSFFLYFRPFLHPPDFALEEPPLFLLPATVIFLSYSKIIFSDSQQDSFQQHVQKFLFQLLLRLKSSINRKNLEFIRFHKPVNHFYRTIPTIAETINPTAKFKGSMSIAF